MVLCALYIVMRSDLVGPPRAPFPASTLPGHFFLEVQGLRPGVYYYKYIVDGTWAVDSLSPKVLDSAGNWNNVLVVQEPPQVGPHAA